MTEINNNLELFYQNQNNVTHYKDQFTNIRQLNGNIKSAVLLTNKVNVVIKQINNNLQPDKNLLQKINELSRAYKHSNVVEFLGINIKDENHENQLFLIMPFANDGDLRSYIRTNQLPFDKKIEIAINIASGIMFLHKNNIIHENINPKNILIFGGIAKISNLPLPYNSNTELYFNENLFDNIGYIDPNSFLNKNYQKDRSIDIYSMGSLLWEIMSEKVPYSKDQYDGILQLIIKIGKGYREEDITGVPDEYINLYKNCWDEINLNRPKIDDVYDELLNMKPGNLLQ